MNNNFILSFLQNDTNADGFKKGLEQTANSVMTYINIIGGVALGVAALICICFAIYHSIMIARAQNAEERRERRIKIYWSLLAIPIALALWGLSAGIVAAVQQQGQTISLVPSSS